LDGIDTHPDRIPASERTREKLKALIQGQSKVAARTAEFHHQTHTRQEGGLHPPYLLPERPLRDAPVG
jgi:hypothetical protein